MPPVNITAMQLSPKTREFLLRLVEARQQDIALASPSLALTAEFCDFLRDESGHAELQSSD